VGDLTSVAFVFDLDGTLVGNVYQHVLFWREALETEGMALAAWRIHRRIGMSGGHGPSAVARDGRGCPCQGTRHWFLSGGYSEDELLRAGAMRVYADPADLLAHLDEVGVRER